MVWTLDQKIQLVAIIVTFLITLVLAGITFWYGWHTSGMAKTMEKQYELENTPYVSIDKNYRWEVVDGKTQFTFSAINLGKIPAKLEFDELTFEGDSVISDRESVPFILYPGQSTHVITEKIDLNGFDMQNKANLNIKIIYWAQGISEKKYYFEKKYEYYGQPGHLGLLGDDAGKVN